MRRAARYRPARFGPYRGFGLRSARAPTSARPANRWKSAPYARVGPPSASRRSVRRAPLGTQFPGYLHVANHGPPDIGDLAAMSGGRIDHLLHPVDMGGKARDDDSLLPA